MRPKLKNVNQPEHPHFYLEKEKKSKTLSVIARGSKIAWSSTISMVFAYEIWAIIDSYTFYP